MSPIISPIEKHRNSAGFTLIETLVSLAIMAFITVGLMITQGGHVRTADNSKKRTICTNLAEQGIEALIALRYDDLLNLDGSATEEDYGSIANFPLYKRITRVNRINDDLVAIQVETFWQEAENADSPSVLKMLRTRPPEKGE